MRWFASILAALLVAACATPGANYPKQASSALAEPQETRLGRQLDPLARQHPGTSGFRLLPQGRDGLRARLELAENAERTLDWQYFLIQSDASGKLLMDAVLGAADRGVRVRMLVDGGEKLKSSRTSGFAMHAKVFVLDRSRVFLGSMNFDARSLRLNTEVGLLIDSPELAQQVSARFDAIAQPANSYVPALGPPDASGKRQLVWRTEENGKMVELTAEPSRDLLRGLQTELLSLLPIDDLL